MFLNLVRQRFRTPVRGKCGEENDEQPSKELGLASLVRAVGSGDSSYSSGGTSELGFLEAFSDEPRKGLPGSDSISSGPGVEAADR